MRSCTASTMSSPLALLQVPTPGAIGITAKNAHGSKQSSSFRNGGAVTKCGELVWHGDKNPVHVEGSGEAGHHNVEVLICHVHRHANAVMFELAKGAS
jgi:hypothetical protein